MSFTPATGYYRDRLQTDFPDSPDLSRVLEVVWLLNSMAVESKRSGRLEVAISSAQT